MTFGVVDKFVVEMQSSTMNQLLESDHLQDPQLGLLEHLHLSSSPKTREKTIKFYQKKKFKRKGNTFVVKWYFRYSTNRYIVTS